MTFFDEIKALPLEERGKRIVEVQEEIEAMEQDDSDEDEEEEDDQ